MAVGRQIGCARKCRGRFSWGAAGDRSFPSGRQRIGGFGARSRRCRGEVPGVSVVVFTLRQVGKGQVYDMSITG
jgi:hypothetical protein